MEREDTGAAIEHFTALVDHAPEFATGWVERAKAYFIADLFGPSLGDLEQALALNPQHFEAIAGLAVVMESMGETDKAYRAYDRLRSIHPHHPNVSDALTRLAPEALGREL